MDGGIKERRMGGVKRSKGWEASKGMERRKKVKRERKGEKNTKSGEKLGRVRRLIENLYGKIECRKKT